ncbi:MAG: hypothetical protein P1V81_12180 [Planctomycetota bacterium]|nr:hypothetical protein [Planctomycetota bacterium]
MDALALLCNLHGDGPATLAALRAAGAVDLAGLERLPDEALEELLGGAAPSVGRFRREARLLRDRIDGPDEDEALRLEVAPRIAALSGAPQPESPAVSPVPQEHHEAAQAPVCKPDLELEGYEHQDEARLEVLPEADSLPAPPSTPPAEPARDLFPHAVPRATTPPRPPAGDQDPVVSAVLGLWNHLDHGPRIPDNGTLAESRLEGLRPEEVVLLAQAGIRTLTELAEADTLRISKRMAISFTHLAHLRFLARKLLRASASPAPAAPPTRPLANPASEMELSQPDQPAGGPFA